MKNLIITANDANQRLDKFLRKAVPLLPASLLYKGIRTKRIKVNGKRAEIGYKLQEGDEVSLWIADELLLPGNSGKAFLSAPSTVNILYEDGNILLADKEAGLIVHEDDQEQVDTLINRILHYLYDKGEFDPDRENSFVPALCNRIDRNTAGIVIAAKTFEALQILNDKIRLREVKKEYLCIAHGILRQKSATLKGYHIKDAENNRVKIVPYPINGGKLALTRYRVREERGNYSLLDIQLLTGRTHQIRAHLAVIGHPLLGDTKYGNGREDRMAGHRFQALTSYKVTFDFAEPAGVLDYLKGRCFEIPCPAILEEFHRL